ncbi:hypothetical protein GCM10011499_38950 [Pelagibacterium lentulum]|uniref:Uncharacterized protein n=1 Tax=Pelagibacterium lentulum TaxID=2029865 RepID=A0A916RQQ9_9HYPH|nr:hypothetical protein GCM10011499_38950 [Pelagibacterium lentulum]
MTKSSNTDANQLCLPLEEFLNREAARRAPNREPRKIGEIVAEIVEKTGQKRLEVNAPAPKRDKGGMSRSQITRQARSANPHAEAMPRLVVLCAYHVVCECPEHDYASSETWISF